MAMKYKKYKLYSPSGRKLFVIKAKKLKWVRRPKEEGLGFRPICEHGKDL